METDLFETARLFVGAPLAHRMRPVSLDEFVGHERLLGPETPLYKWIVQDRLPSVIFWGPAGCGKTTLAKVISAHTKSHFESISAVLTGVKDLKAAIDSAHQRQKYTGTKTILFIDEIHRFNKAQQDVLLPHVESGSITLIGATTENPSFEINSALLSRLRVIRFEPLSNESMQRIIERALKDPNQGLGGRLRLSDEAIHWIADSSSGDARRALTIIENISSCQVSKPSGEAGGATPELGPEEVKALLDKALEQQPIVYDKTGEEHFNVISAFIKSIRDSDPHAGLYYLARMLEGGEDPLFIARRLVVLASEDVGNADPRALQIAIAVKDAVDFVGMPEARITLAQAVTYIALAPKSNASYKGIEEALAEVRRSGALQVPLHLRNAVTALMRREGYGRGYRYAHDQPEGLVRQKHLPTELEEKKYYKPKDVGLEKQLAERLRWIEKNLLG